MAAVLKYSIGHSLGGYLASSASYKLIAKDISLNHYRAQQTIKEADYTFEHGINFNVAPFSILAVPILLF